MEEEESRSHSQWNKINSDILVKICQQHVEGQLQSDFRRRVRAVCTWWRSAVTLPIGLPLGLLPIRVPSFSEDDEEQVMLFESSYYIMSPLDLNLNNKGWLIHVTEIKPNTWRLLRPMSSTDILFECTPPIRCEINNLLDYQIRQVMRSYDLAGVSGDGTYSNKRRLCRDVAVSVSHNHQFLTVLLINNQGQLLVWKLGDTKWTKLRIESVDSSCYTPTYDTLTWPGASNYWYFAPFPHGDNATQTKWLHITTHKGKFYIIDCTSGIVCVIEPHMLAAASDPMIFKPSIIMPPPQVHEEEDINEIYLKLNLPLPPQHLQKEPYDGRPWYRFLVECKGQLYYVIDEWPSMDVPNSRDYGTSTFVLNDKDNHCCWDRVDDKSIELEDQVFFILNGPPFSAPTSDLGFGGGGGGWVCYASRCPDYCCIATPSSTQGLEALDSMGYPLYFTCLYKCQLIRLEGKSDRVCHHFVQLSDDEYNSIFFPPPPWLKWHCPARANAQISFMDLPFKHRPPYYRPHPINGPEYQVFRNDYTIDNIHHGVRH